MEDYEDHLAAKREGYVLVVDDVPTTRAVHSLMLSRLFEVKNVASGQEALDLCAERRPDLVLLDVEMPGLNGYDTCRKLRERFDIPIIFVTSYESLDEHLKAYDAGGSDLCVKPVSAEILTRKVGLAITEWRERHTLKAEKEALKALAEQYESSMSERRLLLQFTRVSLNCDSYAELAQNFLHASQRFGVQCCIAIRHEGIESAWSSEGEASAIERAVLAQIATMGKLVQFKNRLALNHNKLSVVVSNMPDEETDAAARIRDSMSALIETAAVLVDNLALRHAKPTIDYAGVSLEEVRNRQHKMVVNIRLLLHEILDNLEFTFDLLATDKNQEERITKAVRDPLDRIFYLLDQSFAFDEDVVQNATTVVK